MRGIKPAYTRHVLKKKAEQDEKIKKTGVGVGEMTLKNSSHLPRWVACGFGWGVRCCWDIIACKTFDKSHFLCPLLSPTAIKCYEGKINK